MLYRLMKVIAVCAGLTFAGAGLAQSAPEAVIKNTVNEVLGVLKTSKDRRVLADVIEKKVLPNFDFREMTKMAVGRHWRDATPAQQRSLENAFRALLVTTYTQALTMSPAAESQVDVRPMTVRPGDDDVTVKTMVKDGSRKPLAVDYRLAKSGNEWKVYDVAVENLSLVTNYRSSFNSEIGKTGIDGLIKALEAKNKQNSEG